MASEQQPGSVPTMKLKVLSNAIEVGNHVFDNIPVDRTIGWIKQHLQNTLPSHPPVDVQRILYQARFLDNDNATLADVFGAPVPEEQAFHLVLRAPRASRLNPASSEPRTASAPPGSLRDTASGAAGPDRPRPRAQVQGASVHPPHIELNIGNIGQQIQQALDQVQAQLHQAGFAHIQIPRVGLAVQRATQAEIDGALRDAGLQGNVPADETFSTAPADASRPSVTVSQQPPIPTPQQQQQPQEEQPRQPAHFQQPNVRITQTLTGTGLPAMQPPNGAGLFTAPGMQIHQQHMQAHQRALDLAAQARQQMMQMRPAQGQPNLPQHHIQQRHADANSDHEVRQQMLHGHQPHARAFAGHVLPGGIHPFNIGVFHPGVAQAGPFQAVPGQPLSGQMLPVGGQIPHGLPGHNHVETTQIFTHGHPLPVHLPGLPPHLRGGATESVEQQRAASPSQTERAPPSSDVNEPSNFAERMQQIQRELEQVTRRTQELSSQRLSALGQMPSSVQQSELRDGFRTMAESLRRMQATLDSLASDPSVASQPGFVPLRTLVQDWLLQVQAVDTDTARWLGQQNSSNGGAASTATNASTAASSSQAPVTAAFPPVTAPATTNTTASINDGSPSNLMLVRDPSGQPHALLVGPQGTFRTPNISHDTIDRLFTHVQRPAVNRNDSFSRFMRRAMGLTEERRQPVQNQPLEPRQALMDRLRAAGAQANQGNQDAQAGQQQVAQAPNRNADNPRDNEAAARDPIRAFVNSLWLLIRIVVMVYLFGGVGSDVSSWFQWRPLGIALMMVVVYLAQQRWMRDRVDAIRVHFEQLLGVPLNRDGAAAARQPNPPQGQDQAGGQQGQGVGTAPDQSAAARAAQAIARVERPGQPAQGNLRERFRSVERAVALFVASLVPGMGEGIIQARQIAEMEARTAAEAAAAQQQRERDEADATEQAAQDQERPVTSEREGLESAATSSSADETAGSSSQVDLPNRTEETSELSRVNKGKERAVEQEEG